MATPHALPPASPPGVPAPDVAVGARAHPADPPAAPSQTVQLRLQLRRAHAGAAWSAELAVPGASGRLTFPDLDALSRWLARLDRRPEGLR